jgi:hypothetical protein
MIRIRSARHLAEIHRALRVGRGLTTSGMARLLRVTPKTIRDREQCVTGIPFPFLLDTAAVFGLDVALVPRPDPAGDRPAGWRPTGTGWPE